MKTKSSRETSQSCVSEVPNGSASCDHRLKSTDNKPMSEVDELFLSKQARRGSLKMSLKVLEGSSDLLGSAGDAALLDVVTVSQSLVLIHP